MAENLPLVCRLCTVNRQSFVDYQELRCHLRVKHGRRELTYDDTLLYEKWPGSLKHVINLPENFVACGKKFSSEKGTKIGINMSIEEIKDLIRYSISDGVSQGISAVFNNNSNQSSSVAGRSLCMDPSVRSYRYDPFEAMPPLVPATKTNAKGHSGSGKQHSRKY